MEVASAKAHRERPKCCLSAFAEPQPGSDAVARLVSWHSPAQGFSSSLRSESPQRQSGSYDTGSPHHSHPRRGPNHPSPLSDQEESDKPSPGSGMPHSRRYQCTEQTVLSVVSWLIHVVFESHISLPDAMRFVPM